MAPIAAPTARPKNGTKNSKPNRNPQNAPPSAPAPVVAPLESWLVLGLLAPAGQLTTAPSLIWINCCCCKPSSVFSIVSAPSAVGNLKTTIVAMGTYSFRVLFIRTTIVENTRESYSPLGIEWGNLETVKYTGVFRVGASCIWAQSQGSHSPRYSSGCGSHPV